MVRRQASSQVDTDEASPTGHEDSHRHARYLGLNKRRGLGIAVLLGRDQVNSMPQLQGSRKLPQHSGIITWSTVSRYEAQGMATNYSNSHREATRAAAYDESFSSNPYRRLIWDWERKILDAIVAEQVVEQGAVRLLDFATGTGRVLAHLEEKVDHAVGLDVSAQMLEVASTRIVRAHLIEGDLMSEDPPALGGPFNVATAFRFFLNAEPALRHAAMNSLANQLDDNGVLVFNNHMNRNSIRGAVTRAYMNVRHRDPDRYSTLSRGEAQELASEAGLTITRVYTHGVWPTSHAERTRMPLRLIAAVDDRLSAESPFDRFCSYEIYVCRRTI